MAKRIFWSIIASLMALTLVLASCGQVTSITPTSSTSSTTPTTSTTSTTSTAVGAVPNGPEMVTVTLKKKDGTTVTKTVEKPKYGGTLTYAIQSDPQGFDNALAATFSLTSVDETSNELFTGDWSMGPAGTGETDWVIGSQWRMSWERGELADSWEMPDDETIVYHLKKGVHWAINPDSPGSNLMAGREFTADDAAYAFNRMWTSPKSALYAMQGEGERLLSATAIDKYTVETKVPPVVQGLHLILGMDETYMSHAREVVEKYGDMSDWHNAAGTGPFILKDFVSGSSITYVKNPDYFETDPIFPENKLPYIDALKQLIIPDASTRLAAFRTGKLDLYGIGLQMSFDEADTIRKNTPDIKLIRQPEQAPFAAVGRMDKQDLPFKDLRVRQAMSMAINRDEMINDYYKGNADTWFPYNKENNPDIAVDIKDMPAAAQEVMSYNPEKAKQLLAEAGYPDGFKTQIITSVADVDVLSIVREYFLAIGIDMEIKPLEAGVFASQARARSFPEMVFTGTFENWTTFKMHGVRAESRTCVGFFPDNPVSRQAYDDLNVALGKDDAKVTQILKSMAPFYVEQCVWGTVLPARYLYVGCWPWVGNFNGEYYVGYYNPQETPRWIWIDKETKKSMGY